jgi:hypothetical protein
VEFFKHPEKFRGAVVDKTVTAQDKALKVFMVDVDVRFQIPVVAASREEAEEIGEEMWEEDMRNGSDFDVSSHATQVTSDSSDYRHTIPYGVDNDHPRRDWTIKQWLDALGGGSST